MAEHRTIIPDKLVPMRVIVCGLQRTGSMSMRTALHQLCFNECYHMATVLSNLQTHPQEWARLIEAKYAGKGTFGKQDFDKLMGLSQACVDLPAALFSAELAEIYPDAKVIILNRDPEKWYESVLNSIHAATKPSLGFIFRMAFCYPFDPYIRNFLKLQMALEKWVMPFDHAKEKSKAIAWFNNQYKEFRDRIPEERRFEFKVQDGWEPLCEYLGVPVPMIKDEKTGKMVTAPFPRVNDRESFLQHFRNVQASSMARATTNMFNMVGKLTVAAAMGYAGYLAWETVRHAWF